MDKYRLKHKKSFKTKRKSNFFKSSLLWMFLLFFSALGAFAYSFSFFAVKEVEIAGTDKIQKEELADFVKEKAKTKVLFFETKSIFLADLKRIERDSKEHFLLISDIQAKKELGGRIDISIKERKPIGVICSFQCYFFDSEGIAFEETSQAMPVLVRTDKEISLGEKALEEPEFLAGIERMLRQEFNVQSKEFSINSSNLEVVTNEGWKALFKLENIDSQASNLKAVLKEEIPAEKRQKLEYIDLRFGNKVFYK